ncbi:MAG: type II secretion system F family protein [Planctomycetota bacterium]
MKQKSGLALLHLFLISFWFSLLIAIFFVPIKFKVVFGLFLFGWTFGYIFYWMGTWYSRRLYTQEILNEIQLSVLEGRSIQDTFLGLEKQSNTMISPVVKRLKNCFEATGSLASALDRYPRGFSKYLRNSIRLAEKHQVLTQILPFLQEESSSKSASFRILFVTFVYVSMLSLGFFMSTPALHRISDIMETKALFKDQNAFAPSLVSHWVKFNLILANRNIQPVLFLGIIFSCCFFILFFAFRKIREHRLFQFLRLQIPFKRKLEYGDATVRHSLFLSAFLKAGLPLHKAYELSVEAEPNIFMGRKFRKIVPFLQEGMKLPQLIQQHLSLPLCYKIRLIQASLSSNPQESFLRLSQNLIQELTRLRLKWARVLYPISILVFAVLITLQLFTLFYIFEQIRNRVPLY